MLPLTTRGNTIKNSMKISLSSTTLSNTNLQDHFLYHLYNYISLYHHILPRYPHSRILSAYPIVYQNSWKYHLPLIMNIPFIHIWVIIPFLPILKDLHMTMMQCSHYKVQDYPPLMILPHFHLIVLPLNHDEL